MSDAATQSAAPTAAPVAEASTAPDYSQTPVHDIREKIAAAIEVPAQQQSAVEPAPAEPTAAAAAPVVEGEPSQTTNTTETAEATEEVPAETTETTEADQAAAEFGEIAPFVFTADPATDPDKFGAEFSDYLQTVEVTPELQSGLDFYRAEVERLREAVASSPPASDDPIVASVVSAVDALVQYEDDGTGNIAPNTKPLRELLAKNFANEQDALFGDMAFDPDPNNPKLKRIHTLMATAFDLDYDGLQRLVAFGKDGAGAVPSYVPPGIDKAVGEAFWTHDDRPEIQTKVDGLMYTIERDTHATKSEIDAATAELAKINNALLRDQKELARFRDEKGQFLTKPENAASAVEEKVRESSLASVLSLNDSLEQMVAKAYSFMDEDGAGLAAMGTMALVQSALDDNDAFASPAREKLKAKGIDYDWNSGRAALHKLDQAYRKLHTIQSGRKPSERAVQLAQIEVNNTLKEMRGMLNDLGGRIVKQTVASTTKKTNTKIAAAPKQPAVRPKGSGAAPTAESASVLRGMSPEEIRSRIGELRSKGVQI